MTLPLLTWRRPDDRPSIDARYAAFHAANPHVLTEMLRLARIRLDSGVTRIGVKLLWEETRESIRVRKLGAFKLDNSLTSRYADALIAEEPRLAAVIERRHRRAA